jgi:hypothetical protein
LEEVIPGEANVRAVAVSANQRIPLDYEASRKKAAGDRASEFNYLSSVKALLEVSRQIRAAIAQVSRKTCQESRASSHCPTVCGPVDVHLKEVAQQLSRMEELARQLMK